jgi:hypothetical protein
MLSTDSGCPFGPRQVRGGVATKLRTLTTIAESGRQILTPAAWSESDPV